MNFELFSFAGAGELARAAARGWIDEIESARRAGTRHSVALSGGRIAHEFFAAVAEEARGRKTRLDHVEFFWADERCVPPSSPESNFRIASELLLAPLGIGEAQIHRIRGEEPPEAAAKSAEAEIRSVLTRGESGPPVLDLVFLGLGEDGHVASLFPGEPESTSRDPAIYRAVKNSPKPPPNRITLGYGALTSARLVWMLAAGAGKQGALKESLQPGGKTPFARVLRSREHTRIFTDFPVIS